jgi:hypothetical protein
LIAAQTMRAAAALPTIRGVLRFGSSLHFNVLLGRWTVRPGLYRGLL